MKIARVLDKSSTQYTVGLNKSGAWVELSGDVMTDNYMLTHREVVPVRWLSPLAPAAIFCIGLNYAKHILESKMPTPQEPVVFMKNPAAAIGHNEDIRIPKVCDDELDFEGELAVVIGKACRDVERKDVNSVIRGYCVANDISARIWQLQRGGSQWVRGKSFDSFAPLGPFIVTPDEIEDPGGLAICTKVNDQTMQNSNTSDMIFDVPALVSFCSQDTTLLPGTVIMTGTPEGVGWTRQPRVTLKAGHQISVEIEGLGCLQNLISG
jgi:2-keto-4-pentenoate hydratase/2-oxohepta-3-ene-1,7-dioic acid hydratase in catechol pathway